MGVAGSELGLTESKPSTGGQSTYTANEGKLTITSKSSLGHVMMGMPSSSETLIECNYQISGNELSITGLTTYEIVQGKQIKSSTDATAAEVRKFIRQ